MCGVDGGVFVEEQTLPMIDSRIRVLSDAEPPFSWTTALLSGYPLRRRRDAAPLGGDAASSSTSLNGAAAAALGSMPLAAAAPAPMSTSARLLASMVAAQAREAKMNALTAPRSFIYRNGAGFWRIGSKAHMTSGVGGWFVSVKRNEPLPLDLKWRFVTRSFDSVRVHTNALLQCYTRFCEYLTTPPFFSYVFPIRLNRNWTPHWTLRLR